ncbi:regulator of sigma E protease [Methylopila capsulata]|uniref:Zinc metalloprotease n=1 Tax=Methylopila capsulata TaxID=61654 RepID=A0A9W6IRK4_9HYPH|nr:RIP metalloprotease RseP [Methylopila capsulata]MBM7849911.1 regulator of sigma E protease [Methylopila capsulata]GLK55201.1 putative zinc metalloprotease [Methylopila capsulata]
MTFLNEMLGAGSATLGYIIPFLFVLTLVIFFHELGHFLVARWTGVKVLAFSLGFGPEIVGFNDRRGTRWRLAAIPLGGYVRFAGDENAASAPDVDALERMTPDERRGSFFFAPLPARAAIVAAGPIANFLLAIVIFACVFMTVGRPATDALVDQVEPGSAAAEAGLIAGDLVTAIDGQKIRSFSDMQRIVSVSAERPLTLTVERGESELSLTATPRQRELTDNFGNKQRVGVLGVTRSTTPGNVRYETFGPIEAVTEGAKETWFVVEHTGRYLGRMVIGRESTDQIGGPIRIAKTSGDVATLGFVALINLAAILSVSIGLLNLLPIPMLDGGHLLFYAVEALRGRPLGARAQEMGMRVGLAFVLMLMIFATWNDIVHLSSLG